MLQQVLGQPLGARGIGNISVEHMLYRGVSAGHGVAHHHRIRARMQVFLPEALHQFDTGIEKLGAHGRVDIGVRSGYPVTQFTRQQCDTSHKSTADSQYMNVSFQAPLRVQRAW